MSANENVPKSWYTNFVEVSLLRKPEKTISLDDFKDFFNPLNDEDFRRLSVESLCTEKNRVKLTSITEIPECSELLRLAIRCLQGYKIMSVLAYSLDCEPLDDELTQ